MPPPLRDILSEPASSVRERERTTFEGLAAAHGNRVVVFGCGGLGRSAINCLQDLHIVPLAFCDNNRSLWHTEVELIPILSVTEAADRYGKDALFVVAVWNPHHWYGETEEMLKAAGAQFICTYLPLFWRFPDTFLKVRLLNDPPSLIYEARDEVLAAEMLWCDDTSLTIYRANILMRALGRAGHMPPRPPVNTYFEPSLFGLIENECVIDCGAYDGDTVRQVLDRYGSSFSAIYSLEGDAISFHKMKEYVTELPADTQKKIHLIHGAVGRHPGMVRFTSDGGTGSKMNEKGEMGIDVACYPLDELKIPEPVTFLKMDIEGAEYESLHGALSMIERDRPLLAVCVYHLQNDLWRIPLFLRRRLPEHRLFLRAYEGDGFQTVVYAVPPARVVHPSESNGLHGT